MTISPHSFPMYNFNLKKKETALSHIRFERLNEIIMRLNIRINDMRKKYYISLPKRV